MNRGDPKQQDCPKNPGTPCRCKREPLDHHWLTQIADINRDRLNREDPASDPSKFVPYLYQKTYLPSADTRGYLPLKYMQAQ